MKHVRAHVKVNERSWALLKPELRLPQVADDVAHIVRFGEYEVRVDESIPDYHVEVVDAHTIKPCRYLKLGDHFWWRKTLYVSPLDPRLQEKEPT